MNVASMGIGKAPNTLSEEKLFDVLLKYKNNTNTNHTKAYIMNEVVSSYTDTELKELSKYITSLK